MIEYLRPFYLVGEAGQSLDATPRLLAEIGINDGKLDLASLDIGTLTFSIPIVDKTENFPDDGQEVQLRDSVNRVLFKGRVTRRFSLSQRRYHFTAEDVWKRLLNAPVKGITNERPYRVYPAGNLQATLASLVNLANGDGLPITTPTSWPTMYSVPRMGLRSRSYGDAILTVLKYLPDAGSRMDYSANPPRINFTRRTAPHVIDLDMPDHGLLDADMEMQKHLHALGITIHYAERTNLTTWTLASQSAGNLAAEADRQVSLLLSGQERMDTSSLDGLNAALTAYNQALSSINEAAAGIDQIAATAGVQVSWDGIKDLVPAIVAARAVRDFSMQVVGLTTFSYYSYYYGYYGNGKPPPDRNITTVPLKLYDAANRVVSSGWWPIRPGSFTSDHLTRAGATSQTMWIRGEFKAQRRSTNESNRGLMHLAANGGTAMRGFTGYTDIVPSNSMNAAGTMNRDYFDIFYFFAVNIQVQAINKSPAQVAAAVKASYGGDAEELADGADFVTAPAGLAENWFNAQNWTPMKGRMVFSDAAPWKPAPGDHVQILTDDEPIWSEAEAAVVGVSIDLETGDLTATAGLPARRSISSLMDALKVPQEDNFV